ncbi:hypothetical protein B0O99DRAFT_239348 [Bisporella sp. PMI_857]|nr:hypothetical protein B0O99DRAFT_239348 [Bisporella sp. PMI_857]
MRGDAGSGQSETTSKRSRKAPKRTASYKSSISRTIAPSPGKETQVVKATRRPRRESLKEKGQVVVKTTSTSKRKNITETEDSLPTIQIKRRKLSTNGLGKDDVSTKRVVHNTRLQRRKVLAKAAENLLLDGAVNHSSTQTIPTVHVYNKKYKQSEFNPGLVISTPWHEPDFVSVSLSE